MTLLPSYISPYGPLTVLHEYILSHVVPLSLTNWPQALIVPLIPLGVQAYLLQVPGTRPYRIPLGVIGVQMMLYEWSHYRFDKPEHNAFNNGLSIAFLHLSVKYLEFAIRIEPLVDPYMKSKGRSRFIAAFDSCINSRMIGLEGKADVEGEKEGLLLNEKGKKNTESRRWKLEGEDSNHHHHHHHAKHQTKSPSRHLPPRNRRRTYSQAVIRHLTHALIHYITLDTLLSMIRHFGRSTIANPTGHQNSIPTFLSSTKFLVLPHTALEFAAPRWLVLLVVELSVGVGVWQGLDLGYHSFALLAVGSGLWEVESWEIDLFDQPWKADSLLDLWGRRWHQLFRHHFVLISNLILNTLSLPLTPNLILPLVFTLSGLLHAFGQISMSPVPHTLSIAGFFMLSGVGCALEVAFRQITGRRVQGPSGRIWTWAWLLLTARLAVSAWLDAGIGGCHLTPEGGIGEVVKNLIVGRLVESTPA